VRVWRGVELLLFGLACLESAIYDHVDWSVLLSVSCSIFACGFECGKRVSIATTVANGCGPMASPRTEKRLGSPPHE
jgi:hypothetical protein